MKSSVVLLVLFVLTIVQSERLYYEPRMIKVIPDRKPQLTVQFPEKKPDFCNNLDCPEFTVVEKTKDYELREYVLTNWVTTSMTGVEYSTASRDMFFRLFNYIQGKNAKKEKIAMTAPVVIRLIPGPGPACESNFTMSFFMSNKVKNPPQPTESTVFLNHAPVFRAYVKQFGGYVTKIEDWISKAQELIKAINDPSKYVTETYFTAGYNSPFEIFHRHNEIWFIAK